MQQNFSMLTRCNRRGLNETDETLAVAIDSGVDPVSDWNFWASVWVSGINITFLVLSRSCVDWKRSKDSSSEECRYSTGLHDGGKLRLTNVPR